MHLSFIPGISLSPISFPICPFKSTLYVIMRRFFLACLCLGALLGSRAQVDLGYYLPTHISYDESIPTPESVLGWQVGEWHVSHDKLVQYMTTVAAASDRAIIDTIGYSYEQRPLLHLTFSTPENLARLEEIRLDHLKISDPATTNEVDIEDMPVVVNMGYSVHGNEPSGSNASLLFAYYLAAAKGPEIEKLLSESIIIVDPSVNPDGMNRFAHWANSNRGIKVLNADPLSREHNETWPRGRTNHYWFDLNRDWLPVQHPESKARIKRFHEWKYNFLTDYHEMGSNSTYFFQPGIPSRNNPLTPELAYELTREVAKFHAAALDSIGSLYYSEESFDDYYYGKGSTYPDVNGGVGILFEQASSRGHVQATVNGDLTFPFTIRNQVNTSLSTIKGTHALRKEFLAYQREFFKSALKEAAKDPFKGYVVGVGKDKAKARAFLDMILRHEIEVVATENRFTKGGKTFAAGSYMVPLDQPQYRLIKAIFTQPTTFKDSLFYDVSAWTLPLAFGLDFTGVNAAEAGKAGKGQVLGPDDAQPAAGEMMGKDIQYAYAFEWHGYFAPRALNRLFEAGIRTKVATRAFTGPDGYQFAEGTILIPVRNQALSPEELLDLMQTIREEDQLDVHALSTGLLPGLDAGSPSFQSLKAPKVLVVVDGGVNGYEAGEVWHLLDYRYQIDATLVPMNLLGRVDLSAYTALVMVNGSYADMKGGAADRIKQWVERGGSLIATKGAIAWLGNQGLGSVQLLSPGKDTSLKNLTYADMRNVRGAQVVGGAIFEAKLDRTHPLGYGYESDVISVFRNSTRYMKASENPAVSPLIYTNTPLLSGYASDENIARMKGTAAINVYRAGRGHVIAMTDNPNFRAFWYGTNKLFMNAIFFGSII